MGLANLDNLIVYNLLHVIGEHEVQVAPVGIGYLVEFLQIGQQFGQPRDILHIGRTIRRSRIQIQIRCDLREIIGGRHLSAILDQVLLGPPIVLAELIGHMQLNEVYTLIG